MPVGLFLMMLEHNDWANQTLLAACTELSDEQLDATPDPLLGTWSIRTTLHHMADAQRGYLGVLAPAAASKEPPARGLDVLARSLSESGRGLQAVARDEATLLARPDVPTSDGYLVTPWIVLVQAVNHTHDHRRQVCRMLQALGRTPPRLDGWGFGEATGAVRERG